ncbi:hypothetical protein ACIQNU_24820 [Streptomyces sp. NPDC091292]|uniref:hypothetical protein n=1 Tax=Streptomyces sp. NPDC091292 TaxID=3365991 RepID=UPI00382964D5
MTGSTPPRKRRFRKQREADPGLTEGARDDERGRRASLEVADGTGSTGALEGADALTRGVQTPATGAVPGRTRKAVESLAGGAQSRTRNTVAAVRNGARRSADSARAGLAYLTDRVIENAPRVPVRDLATLRRQFPGLGPEDLADKLVTGAANATSTVGAGVGAAAMMPVPPAMPAEMAAEITGVAAIELKLIAELYEVYGLRPPGTLKDRSTAYLTAWSEERGIDVTKPSTINGALGGQMKRELRQQIMKRMVRNLPNLMPFMVGAAVGAVMNRRDTKKLAERIRRDLRKNQVPWNRLTALPPLERPAGALSAGEPGHPLPEPEDARHPRELGR